LVRVKRDFGVGREDLDGVYRADVGGRDSVGIGGVERGRATDFVGGKAVER